MSEQPCRTFTKFPIAEARASVAGRRHKTPHVPRSLRVNIQATQTARNEELPYDLVFDTVRPRIDFNKPLPPLPDQKPSSRPSSRCETPRTPIDKAAHWVNKKVITPMRELFHTPEVTEMITPSGSQVTGMTGHSLHKTRIMEQESPPRSRDSHAFLAEFYSQADSNRQSRAKPRVDRQATPRHSRGSSSGGVSQRPTMAHKSRGSESSVSNSVRTALETSVGTAKDVGHRFRLGHESERLVFSDSAPPGMMDPCSVCGKEPKGVLYHGKCRDCKSK